MKIKCKLSGEVFDVYGTEITNPTGVSSIPKIQFLIWRGSEWKVVNGYDFRPHVGNDKKNEYIRYFEHMQAEHERIPLGGMAWDDIGHWVKGAIENVGMTREELAEMFPSLLGHLIKEG